MGSPSSPRRGPALDTAEPRCNGTEQKSIILARGDGNESIGFFPVGACVTRGGPSAPPADGTSMQVLLTGATGFVGGHLCRRLVSAGHSVLALVRDPAKGAGLPREGVERLEGDLSLFARPD